MNTAKADALTAREHLAACGWIAPRNESFRHLPPPPAGIWLGDGAEISPDSCDASPLSGTGWTLYPVGDTLQCSVAARWLDASDPQQRAELFSGLAQPGGSDAAPFVWAHRALCRQGLRLRVGASPSEDPGKTVWLHLRHQSRSTVEAPMLVVDVHCRIGSSENQNPGGLCRTAVHCRIGSSEIKTWQFDKQHKVHCRIGSSDIHSSIRDDPLDRRPCFFSPTRRFSSMRRCLAAREGLVLTRGLGAVAACWIKAIKRSMASCRLRS